MSSHSQGGGRFVPGRVVGRRDKLPSTSSSTTSSEDGNSLESRIMDCPHLQRCRIGGRSLLNKISNNVTGTGSFGCLTCSSKKNPWLCVHCGHIACGRYVGGHAKAHYEDKRTHCLTIDINTYAVYCYACDEFVINDSRSRDLSILRSKLQSVNEHENVSNSSNNSTSTSSSSRRSQRDRSRDRKTSNNSSSLSGGRDRGRGHREMSESVVGGSETSHRSHHHHHDGNQRHVGHSIAENSTLKRSGRRSKNDLGVVGGSSTSSTSVRSAKKMKRSCQANIAGLRNLGNTCFMNAVLQSLSNIPEFYEYFKELPSLEPSTKKSRAMTSSATNSTALMSSSSSNTITPFVSSTRKSPSWIEMSQEEDSRLLLAEELRKTLQLLWSGSKGAISPESLFQVIWKVVPRYRGYQQQDAHEFLRYMLDRLHTELLGILPHHRENDREHKKLVSFGKTTIVTGIFGGILQNEVTCLACGNESRKHDPFLDLSLDLPDDCSNRSTDSGGNSNDSNQGPDRCHLFDCLSSFIRLEELEDTELYLCPNCKKKQKSTKRFWIRRLPNVLCLHLKRFRWNNYLRTKLETFVEYPLRSLDMSQYVLSNKHETRRSGKGSTEYDLAAVIVHHGSGVGSGHYTAYATHGGCWHHFNDSNVTVCEEDTVANSNAYILFYVRRELNMNPFSFS